MELGDDRLAPGGNIVYALAISRAISSPDTRAYAVLLTRFKSSSPYCGHKTVQYGFLGLVSHAKYLWGSRSQDEKKEALIGTGLLQFNHECAAPIDLDSLYRIRCSLDERIREILEVVCR